MNLIFEIDRQRLLDGSTGAPIASLQFSYPDKYPVTISITRGNQPYPVTGNVYVTLKPASTPLSAPLALLTIPVNGSATATGILDTYVQEMDDWVPAANKRAAQFEVLVVSTVGGTEVSVDVPAQVSRRYNSVDQPGVTVAEKSLASQAEAEAGTNNTKWMSPLRVAQAISHLAEFADTTDELSEGTTNLYFTEARAKAALADELSEIGSNLTELGTALDGKASTSHKSTHAIGGSDALTPADIGAAEAIHIHAISDTTGLQTALDGKVTAFRHYDTPIPDLAPAALGLRDNEDFYNVALQFDGRLYPQNNPWQVLFPDQFRDAISAACTTNFAGANGTSAGTAGLVPAPAATDNTKFLKGDGTWTLPSPADIGAAAAGEFAGGFVEKARILWDGPSEHTGLEISENMVILGGTQWDGGQPSPGQTRNEDLALNFRAAIGAAPAAHTHAIADTTGLQAALAGKQPTGSYVTRTDVQGGGSSYFERSADAASQNVGYGQSVHQIVLGNDTRLTDPRRVQWFPAPPNNYTIPNGATAGAMAYDGSFLYVIVSYTPADLPSGYPPLLRWARTPLSMTW